MASVFDLVKGLDSLRSSFGGGQAPTNAALQPTSNPGQLPELAQRFGSMRSGNSGVMPLPGPRGSGTYDQWVDTVAKMKGLTAQERDAFYALGMGESGGQNIPQGIHDINTEKGTPAFGPWQVIEPTFRQYMEPGYSNWQDPIANGLASINYQRANYGRILSKPGY